jgi:polyhydroxybutyrate depolymerase
MRRHSLGAGIALLVASAFVASACSSSSGSAAAPGRTRASTSIATSTTAPTRTTAPACDRPHAPGQIAASFVFQGKTRTYQLYVPAAYTGTRAVPVVFNFHGFGSNAIQQMAYGNFKPLADQHDFVIVAPDGQESAAGRHFNLTFEKGLQNDITMVGALITHIEQSLCVDPARVYATGMSDGGAMTSALACDLANKFAAFAAVAVVIYLPGCGDTNPVALAAFSGTADPVVPFQGGAVHCCGGTVLPAPSDSMAKWAAHDHCSAAFTDTRLGSQVRKRTWKGCTPPDAPVFYIIDGGGHTWPGSIPVARLGMTTQQIHASDVIWKFFEAHTLAR